MEAFEVTDKERAALVAIAGELAQLDTAHRLAEKALSDKHRGETGAIRERREAVRDKILARCPVKAGDVVKYKGIGTGGQYHSRRILTGTVEGVGVYGPTYYPLPGELDPFIRLGVEVRDHTAKGVPNKRSYGTENVPLEDIVEIVTHAQRPGG